MTRITIGACPHLDPSCSHYIDAQVRTQMGTWRIVWTEYFASRSHAIRFARFLRSTWGNDVDTCNESARRSARVQAELAHEFAMLND